MFMDSTTNNDPATVVFIEKNDDMSMSSDNKDVIYVKAATLVLPTPPTWATL